MVPQRRMNAGHWEVRIHTKGVYCALFLGLQNVGNFEFAVKCEAIVDAPWVRLCISGSFLVEMGWNDYIYILRGVILPLLIPLQWYFLRP